MFIQLFNKPSKILKYISDSSYWIYIVHTIFLSFIPGVTDSTGNFSIICPISGVQAGQARVNIEFNSYENNAFDPSSFFTLFPISITRFDAEKARMLLEEQGYKINIIHQLWIKPFRYKSSNWYHFI